MPSVLVIRHAFSTVNKHDKIPTSIVTDKTPEELDRANRKAQLTSKGRREINKLAPNLRSVHGIVPATTPVAVSHYKRTGLTAKGLGFKLITPYQQLDEARITISREQFVAILSKGRVPDEAIRDARRLLAKPPKENVWVTHGILIAALCQILHIQGIPQENNIPIPPTCAALRIEF